MGYMSGKEIDLMFLFRYANQYPRAIRKRIVRPSKCVALMLLIVEQV